MSQEHEQRFAARFKEAWGRPALDATARARLDARVRASLAGRPVVSWRLGLAGAAAVGVALAIAVWPERASEPAVDEANALLAILADAEGAVRVADDWLPEAEASEGEVWGLDGWRDASPAGAGATSPADRDANGADAAVTVGANGQAAGREALWPADYQGLAEVLGIDLWS